MITCVSSVDIHAPLEQRLHSVNVPLFRGSVQRILCLVFHIVIRGLNCVQCRGPSIWIRFVLGNELCNLSLAILRCQLGCTSTGLVKHVDISTPPKQQLYNSEMPMSRRGMQYSPAVVVRSMHSRSVFDQETGDRGISVHNCSIQWSFLLVI